MDYGRCKHGYPDFVEGMQGTAPPENENDLII
jgi:hypothetical protein